MVDFFKIRENCSNYFHLLTPAIPNNNKNIGLSLANGIIGIGKVISIFTLIIPAIVWTVGAYANNKLEGRVIWNPLKNPTIDKVTAVGSALQPAGVDPTAIQVTTLDHPKKIDKKAELKAQYLQLSEAEASVMMERLSRGEKEEKESRVIVVGRSGGGKSTIKNVIANGITNVEPQRTSLFKRTKDLELTPIPIKQYTIHFLDTPGLQEEEKKGMVSRTDENIVSNIDVVTENTFGGKSLENVDVVMMTITSHPTPEELAAIKIFLAKIPEGTKKILLITRSETMRPERRNAIIKQMNDYKPLGSKSSFGELFNQILFCGSLDKGSIDDKDEDAILNQLVNIQNDREKLIKALLPKDAEFESEIKTLAELEEIGRSL